MRVYGTDQRGAIAAAASRRQTRSNRLAPRAKRATAGLVAVGEPGSAMKRLLPHDRPREKLARVGAGALGDNELLALVLGQGSRDRNALELATELLDDVGGLYGLSRAGRDQLRGRPGVGPIKAARIVAAVELGRRTLIEVADDDRPQFLSPREVAAYLMPRFGARGVEQFGVMLLDTRHRLIRTTLLTVGVLDATYMHPRELFREALTGGAAVVVLFHNHPSGDPAPSGDDVLLTARLFEAGVVIGIPVVDHVVVADTRYFSFRENDGRPIPGLGRVALEGLR